MLKSFQIDNFRLFQHLEVRNLSRVNLIVGKNNAGKSSFLEALKLYASNSDPFVLLDLIQSRQETWSSEVQPRFQTFLANPVRHLFFDHKLPKIGDKGIYIGEISSSMNLSINIGAYQEKNDEEGSIKKIRISDIEDEDFSSIEAWLIIEENERTRRLFRLDRSIEEIRRNSRLSYEKTAFESRYRLQTVATENMPNQKIANLWDLTSLTDLESDVYSALKLIDSRVTGVAFVEDIINRDSGSSSRLSRSNRIPLVKLKGIDEPLPLKSMGDGMTRLFHIIVSLVNAKDGLLLIDEFENGLHWGIQPKVWDIIFQLSEKLNVQVFATTHSRDCITSFDSAWNKYPEFGAFFRLDRKNDMIKATEYTLETLTDSLETDVEVR